MAAIDDSAKLANTSVGEEAQMLCKLLMASLGELGFAHGERRTMRLKDQQPQPGTPSGCSNCVETLANGPTAQRGGGQVQHT